MSDYYKEVAGAYDASAEAEEYRVKLPLNSHEYQLNLEIISNLLFKKRAGAVLDIGSGPGNYSIWATSISDKVVSVDVSGRSLSLLKLRAEMKGVNNCISTFELDALEFLKIDQNIYDFIICFGPCYHAENSKYVSDLLVRAYDSMSSEAIIIFNYANPYSILKKLLSSGRIESCQALEAIDNLNKAGECFFNYHDLGVLGFDKGKINSIINSAGFRIRKEYFSKNIYQKYDLNYHSADNVEYDYELFKNSSFQEGFRNISEFTYVALEKK